MLSWAASAAYRSNRRVMSSTVRRIQRPTAALQQWNQQQQRTSSTTFKTASSVAAAVPETDDLTASAVANKNNKTSNTAYLDLAKAKLTSLVVTTTAIGFVGATGPHVLCHLPEFCAVTAGTALCSGAAAAANQIIEVPRDAQMKRTQQRPLVNGSLTVPQATSAAAAWGVLGTSCLYMGCDPVTAGLGAGNMALYAGLYTWMKPRYTANTWVGAVVGAVPPVMGWTAGSVAVGASSGTDYLTSILASADWATCGVLVGTLFLWQIPHFLALSHMYRHDYARGGFAMVPVVHGVDRTAQLVVRYTWYLSTVPILAYALDTTSGSMFVWEGCALNAYALKVAYDFQRDQTNAKARHVFLTSLWYLPCLLMLFVLHSTVWDEEEQTTSSEEWLSSAVHAIRSKGRDLCLHEAAVFRRQQMEQDEDSKDNSNNLLPPCPVTVGSQAADAAATEAATVVEQVTTNPQPLRLATEKKER